MDITVLASGSKGNCSLIDSGDGLILVDAGISGKRIIEKISEAGKDSKDLVGLVLTHDHRDHISGAGIISRRLKIPVYTSPIIHSMNKEILKNCDVKYFNGRFNISSLEVTPIPISHDGSDNYGYIFEKGGKKIGHITDLGVVTSLVKERLRSCNILVLESNHDLKMLKEGPYPWYLKQRILGKKGHISNVQSSDLVKEIYSERLKDLVLAHLSEENNDPVIAYDNMDRLRSSFGHNYSIHVAKQNTISETFVVDLD
ncbi:MAG: MBL fold metallo-hydrolase [Candidatus Cloacimonadota bacterium]|nr:MAG: MBL fold metallo-hydrolase [Candidatus Cloacimonadota bacterium]PIE78149.1 MAG: MBL fold metallo-hydrolase [Candidatus Delongbacteria bacterium]